MFSLPSSSAGYGASSPVLPPTYLPRAHKHGPSSDPQTRIPTFSRTISPPSTPSNRHFRAPRVPKHPPTSPSVRAPVTARPWVEACQFPRASFFGLPTAGPRTRAGLPRRFSRDPSSTPKRWLGQQAREDTVAVPQASKPVRHAVPRHDHNGGGWAVVLADAGTTLGGEFCEGH